MFFYNHAEIKFKPNDFLPLEKTLIFHNGIKLMKQVIHKIQNHFCYNIFLKTVLINCLKIMIINKFLRKLKFMIECKEYKEYKELCYDRTDISEVSDVNKTSNSISLIFATIDIF